MVGGAAAAYVASSGSASGKRNRSLIIIAIAGILPDPAGAVTFWTGLTEVTGAASARIDRSWLGSRKSFRTPDRFPREPKRLQSALYPARPRYRDEGSMRAPAVTDGSASMIDISFPGELSDTEIMRRKANPERCSRVRHLAPLRSLPPVTASIFRSLTRRVSMLGSA